MQARRTMGEISAMRDQRLEDNTAEVAAQHVGDPVEVLDSEQAADVHEPMA